MKNIIKILCTAIILSITIISLVGCGSNESEVYLLNFKPEEDKAFKEIADKYREETGVNVKVQTAASNQYESTLQSEILKTSKPSIFIINGPIGYQSWKNYTLDLRDTAKEGYHKLNLYDDLLNKSLAVQNEEGVFGIPTAIEGYGLVYNKKVFNEYFLQENRSSNLSSLKEVSSFNELKTIVEDLTKYITGNKKAIDAPNINALKGVFVSTSLKEGSAWPYTTHLLNIPMIYEFKKQNDDPIIGGLELKEIEFTYHNEYKALFDLYINNSLTSRNLLGDKSYDDAVSEFATGKAAFIQQGNWVYSNIKSVAGNTINDDDIGMIPIYLGIEKENNSSISVGTENYWCINKTVSKDSINASIDFINWLFTGNGRKYVSEKLGFISPFKQMEEYKPSDPLSKEVLSYIKQGKETLPWAFVSFPSEKFKSDFNGALLYYVQGKMTWEDVVKTVKDSWKKEAS